MLLSVLQKTRTKRERSEAPISLFLNTAAKIFYYFSCSTLLLSNLILKARNSISSISKTDSWGYRHPKITLRHTARDSPWHSLNEYFAGNCMFFSGKTREFVLTCGRQRMEFVQTWCKRSSYHPCTVLCCLLRISFLSRFAMHILIKLFKMRKIAKSYVSYGHLSNRFLSFNCKAKKTDTITENILLLTLNFSWINVWFSCVILQLPKDYPGLAPI